MKQALIWSVKFYKKAISPFLPHGCRFTPSCSSYFLEAIKMHGALKGSWFGLVRVLRCNPLSRGGYDPVK